MKRALAAGALLLGSLGGSSAATGYVAAHARNAEWLGPPAASLGTTRIDAPWAWLLWERRAAGARPELFRKAGDLTSLGAIAGILLAMLIRGGRSRAAPSRAYGSSRWATAKELRDAGLLGDAGVVLCQTSEARFDARIDRSGKTIVRQRRLGALVRHDGPEHVLCFAPTGSGKGVGLVVPTLLSWPHSVLVYDVKKENWALTAGWRRQFSRVWRFEPTALDSVRFNPLLEVRRGLSEVRDVQNIADILVDPNGEKESRDHWHTTAHGLLTGAILHVLYAEADKTLAGVAAFLSDPSRKQTETLQRMMTTAHLPQGPHPAVAQIAREMMNKSDNELSGVYSTAMSCLGLYRDPVIARATSASDFRIADLVDPAVPASLYLVVPPSDLSRTRPVVRLLLNQMGRRLTEAMEVDRRQRLLLLLDEFPTLGRLDFFESALAFVRGYGIKAFLIAQSLNQLEKAYGASSSILDNCHVRLTYAANDDRTAKRISDLLGQATETRTQRSYSGSGLFLSHRTESEQEFGRSLLTPAEVTQLSADEGVLLVGGTLPYRAKKVRYFLDPRFRARAALPPPDRAREQAAELPARVASDWSAAVCFSRDLEPGRRPERPAEGLATETPSASGTGEEDVWDAFFASDDDESASPGETDDWPEVERSTHE